MRLFTLAPLALALAFPAAAQEALPTEGDINVSFTWSSVDLASVPAPGEGTVTASEVYLVLTATEPGLIDRLAGSCMFQLTTRGESYAATGSCAFADADGDMLFDSVTDHGDTGEGVLTGGTGKFAGITGEYGYTTSWVSSIRKGVNQGIGAKSGTWKREAM